MNLLPVCSKRPKWSRKSLKKVTMLLCWRALELMVPLAMLLHTATAQSATEYQVKAAFLFNFAKFVEWPADAFPTADTPLQICVLGRTLSAVISSR